MNNQILTGDALTVLKTLPSESVDCVITSPPYWGLRNYGVDGQIGMEPDFDDYLKHLLLITAECKRVLKKTGTMFWNHGDCYGGSWHGPGSEQSNPGKHKANVPVRRPPTNTRNKAAGGVPRGQETKSLLMQPYRLAMHMCDEQGWLLRNIIVWHKRNCMPSSIKDRFTVDYEPIFFFTKSRKYAFNQQFEPQLASSVKRMKYDFGGYPGAIYPNEKRARPYAETWKPNPKGRNKRSVWSVNTAPGKFKHHATFPEKLVEPMILAGSPIGGVVLDPFFGSGTVGAVALKFSRNFIGIELNPSHVRDAEKRLSAIQVSLFV